MLVNATVSKLAALGLSAMAAGLADQLEAPGPWSELSFEDRLGLLADREADARDSRRLANRLKAAKLRYPAAIEDIDFRTPRGLDRATIASLAGAGWVARGHNVLITGATGCEPIPPAAVVCVGRGQSVPGAWRRWPGRRRRRTCRSRWPR